MTNIGHGRQSRADDLHLDDLAPIQIALGFIGIEVAETDRVNIEEENAADRFAGPWEEKWVP